MESPALGGLSRLLLRSADHGPRQLEDVAPRWPRGRAVSLPLLWPVCPGEPASFGAYRRHGVARASVPTHQRRRLYVLHLRRGDVALLRRKPGCGIRRLARNWSHGGGRGTVPARRPLATFLLDPLPGDHWSGEYFLCRTQPHEPEIAQGERRNRASGQSGRARTD